MTSLIETAAPLDPPLLEGNPYERGRQLAGHFHHLRDQVEATAQKAVRMRDEGGEGDWMRENELRLRVMFPEIAEYFRGQADGFGITEEDIITSAYSNLLTDRKKARKAHHEGEKAWGNVVEECSTFAFNLEGAGALVAKNRDNPPANAVRHIVALHRDPAWNGGWVLGVTTAGGVMAASSGMNHHGLVMVVNAAHPRKVEDGFMKSWVADMFLSRCRSVKEALAMIRVIRHAGEGNMILADASGAMAAVGFGGSLPAIETSNRWVARTNHFVSGHQEHLNMLRADILERGKNSRARLEYLTALLSCREFPWKEGWSQAAEWSAQTLSHSDENGRTTLCWNDKTNLTSSGAIFRTNTPALLISDGPPDQNRWSYWEPSF